MRKLICLAYSDINFLGSSWLNLIAPVRDGQIDPKETGNDTVPKARPKAGANDSKEEKKGNLKV